MNSCLLSENINHPQSNILSVKVSHKHHLGYHVERMVYCSKESGEPLTDDCGELVMDTCVDAGMSRSLFVIFLIQWMTFGSMVMYYLFDLRIATINLFSSLLFMSIVSLARRLYQQQEILGISLDEITKAVDSA